MITYTTGNLLDAKVEALVNTVNTVGIMGKGIALMFKEAFPDNFKAYAAACENGDVKTGRVFLTTRDQFIGPKWIINFPTKEHWRSPSKIEWIEEGLNDLKRVIEEKKIRSIALPPLGSGNGGLDWSQVRPKIEAALSELRDVEVVVYEPTHKYQNVAKRSGVEKLTPARALIAELVRRYSILGLGCTLLEIQKLAWFLERSLDKLGLDNPLKLQFEANKFGPYANKLTHLLDALDGSYLHCDKRIADASPLDLIAFEDAKKDYVSIYLTTPEAKEYRAALDSTSDLIDGFESPLGMELLATIDWLLVKENVQPTLAAVREGIAHWPAGKNAADRKSRLFGDRLIELGLKRVSGFQAASLDKSR